MKTPVRICGVAAIAAAALSLAGASPRPVSEEAPKGVLRFVNDRIDLDTVRPGVRNRGELLITNAGAEPFRIVRVATSCSCTEADYDRDRETVAPGDTLRVTVTYITRRRVAGGVHQSVFVTSTAANRKATAFLTAYLKP